MFKSQIYIKRYLPNKIIPYVLGFPKTHSNEMEENYERLNEKLQVIDQIWAGPSHWKLKFLRRSRARYSGAVEVQAVARPRKKLKTKEPEPIDFLNSDNDEEELEKVKRIKIKKKIYPAKYVSVIYISFKIWRIFFFFI